MVIYPREGHAIKEPRHREDVLRRVLAWFAKYDKPPPPRLTPRARPRI